MLSAVMPPPQLDEQQRNWYCSNNTHSSSGVSSPPPPSIDELAFKMKMFYLPELASSHSEVSSLPSRRGGTSDSGASTGENSIDQPIGGPQFCWNSQLTVPPPARHHHPAQHVIDAALLSANPPVIPGTLLSLLARSASQNVTETVAVPSSEHVAEIVGRQGCKIKALRSKTNTYIKTPVRGEDSVFVITGRPDDVAEAKKDILLAGEHFTQIRASRRHSQGGTPAPGHITAYVRVPLRVVGLVVGPKGATIKRIQQDTHTYIITPSREREPIFEVTGLPYNVEKARREIEVHIYQRTGSLPVTESAAANALKQPIGPANRGSQQNLFDQLVGHSAAPTSANELAASFANGVPLIQTGASPVLAQQQQQQALLCYSNLSESNKQQFGSEVWSTGQGLYCNNNNNDVNFLNQNLQSAAGVPLEKLYDFESGSRKELVDEGLGNSPTSYSSSGGGVKLATEETLLCSVDGLPNHLMMSSIWSAIHSDDEPDDKGPPPN